jgi:hypothetical protein
MPSPYSYTIDCEPDALKTEIEAGTFGASVTGIYTEEVTVGGDRNVLVHTSPDLTAGEETELDGIIATHTP